MCFRHSRRSGSTNHPIVQLRGGRAPMSSSAASDAATQKHQKVYAQLNITVTFTRSESTPTKRSAPGEHHVALLLLLE